MLHSAHHQQMSDNHMDNDVRMTIRLPGDLKDDLKDLAKDAARSVGDYVRMVLEEHALAQLGPRG